MEVILLEKVLGLGDVGAVVKVKDGFAKNFLLSRKKVLRATPKNKEIFEQKKALLEQKNIEKKAQAEIDAAAIAEQIITIIRQAGEDGKLYGSVTTRDIAKAVIDKLNIIVSDEMIVMNKRIKEIAFHDVSINLHPDVSVNIKINVARTEQEAIAAVNLMRNVIIKEKAETEKLMNTDK